MADAAMSTVVNKLTELAGQEVRLLLQVVEEVKSLTDKFEWLQALLNDAEQQRRTSKNPFVALWIRQARDTAFEVEDVLDEFSRKVEKVRLPGYGNWKDVLKFRWATDCFTRVLVTHQLSGKIANINVKLDELEKNKETYKIELHPSSSSWTPSFNKTIPTWGNQDSEAPIGLESQVQELIKQLKEGGEERKIISLIGHNGSGRSMLAKKAYGSCEIQNHFEIVAWKNLPPMFRLMETLSDIYWKILEQEGKVEDDCNKKNVRSKLCALLRERRYLIVLNGIDSLVNSRKIILSKYLPDDKNGSRIVLIPRIGISEIARLSQIEGITAFEQKLCFSTDESFELFGQKFPQKSFYPKEYGKYISQIYGVTKGHPMTIVLLAGLLGTKEVSAWETVFQQLKESREAYPIDRMLSLSIDYLPHQLKSCFMYFAAVPQSTGIEANQLVRIWVAEGFIQSNSGKRMEEVGESYLNELISMSLVRIEEKDEFGGPAVVTVDSHIHSFLQFEAQESNFVQVHDNSDLVSPAKVRRLSIQNYTHGHVKISNVLPKLRTLLCDCLEKQNAPELHQMRFLLELKYLRVLDLHGLNIKQLPSGISSMIHLRYLGIRCSRFEELPSSIGKLLNLQTLDTRKSSLKNVPDSFWRIRTLRHILSDHVKLPQHLKEHTHLQTLQIADCTNWNHNKYQLLENISNIRILKLKELSTNQVEVLRRSFSILHFLKHLSLMVREGESISTRILTKSSLRCVQSMELHGQLQEWKSDKDVDVRYNMPNLICLTLIMSNLGQNFINHLSELPSLTKLRILKAYNEKNIEFRPHGFQNLQELKLSGLDELEEWKEVAQDALPKLKNLILIGCPKIKSFPNGLQNLKLLEEISVYNMGEIIEGIREKTGDNYEKIKHVETIKLRRDSNVDYSSTTRLSML